MKRRKFLTTSTATAAVLALNGLGLRESRAATALPAWVANLPLWQWYQIPNTALSSITPNPLPLGNSGPQSKIDAWCGATLKRSGSVYMLGAAGGHSDYAGNEVNALQLNTSTPAWIQLGAPTPNSSILGNSTQYNLDLRPSSTHTYYATQFIESQNRMLVMPSPGVNGVGATPPSGWPYMDGSQTYSFNVSAGDWDAPGRIPKFPGSGDFTACLCAKHPLTDNVYYSRNYGDGWYCYSPSTNTWTKLSSQTRAPWYAGAAIDPVRNRMLVVGGYNPGAPEVHNLDGSVISVSFGGLGATAITLNGYPGVIFDETNDAYLVIFNSGSSIGVLRVNASTWNVDAPSISGLAPAARHNGIQNSAQYVPELGGFLIANQYGGNVYFMRTSSSGQSVPPANTTPPPAPTGLTVS